MSSKVGMINENVFNYNAVKRALFLQNTANLQKKRICPEFKKNECGCRDNSARRVQIRLLGELGQ